MAGVNANFQLGLSATAGTAAQSRSYAYDEAQYQTAVPAQFFLYSTSTWSNASTVAFSQPNCNYFVSALSKQLKSYTAVPVSGATGGTAIISAGDAITLTLLSMYAQTFGTATGPSYFVGSNTSGTFYGSSTNTGTNMNAVLITSLTTFMTGQGGYVQGTGSLAHGTAPVLPLVWQLAGGTFTVTVANGVGTNVQSNYVFPVGPNGGLTINPGDVLVVSQPNTQTSACYAGELEFVFTPGGLFSR